MPSRATIRALLAGLARGAGPPPGAAGGGPRRLHRARRLVALAILCALSLLAAGDLVLVTEASSAATGLTTQRFYRLQ